MTDLKPCPFCGGEAEMLHAVGEWWAICKFCKATTEAHTDKGFAIAAWNARATGGTLAAEQVREAVMSADRWEKPMGSTGLTNTHLIIRDDGWQAIADELNARAERTCRNISGVPLKFRCSECGDVWGKPSVDEFKFCPNCGAKVVDA